MLMPPREEGRHGNDGFVTISISRLTALVWSNHIPCILDDSYSDNRCVEQRDVPLTIYHKRLSV